jgi:hypothetical protein
MVNYAEYIAENLDKNIAYAEYIAENVDNNIIYSEYIAEHIDHRDLAKEQRELREKKLKRILDEI